MGGACLRGHGHRWPGGGTSGPATRGWGQNQLADQPDVARAHAGAERLPAGGDADAIYQRIAQDQHHAHADAKALDVGIGVALGDRCDQRLGHTVPVADRHDDAVTVAERQRESVELALAELP